MEDREKHLRKLEKELSPRHLKFARLVAEGETSYTAAYGQCYPSSAESAWASLGSRLMSNAKVRLYVELMTGLAADEVIVNRTEVLSELWHLAKNRYGNDSKAAGAAGQALKTLLEYLTPKEATTTRVELTGKDGGPVRSERGLSDNMVRSILVGTMGLSDEAADNMLGKVQAEDEASDETD